MTAGLEGIVGSVVRIGHRTEVYAVHEGVLLLQLRQVSLLVWELEGTHTLGTPARLAVWLEGSPSVEELALVAEGWRRVRRLRSEIVLESSDYVTVLDGEPS